MLGDLQARRHQGEGDSRYPACRSQNCEPDSVSFSPDERTLLSGQRLLLARNYETGTAPYRVAGICRLLCNSRKFHMQTEEEWLASLTEGCKNIGRNLNDTRGLFHSFRDCRETVLRLFDDLVPMVGKECLAWEVAFELRLKQSRYVRIYADVLIITENRVFSLEFKMKDRVDPDEVLQAAKYSPYLEILFGPDYEIIPVLVLTRQRETFDFAAIGKTDAVLPDCSGDMLFNVFDEYMGFLKK